MTYSVKEIFYTLQGEGAQTGRPAVFCRFSGCNLWTGREQDRNGAVCTFCDTDFIGTNGENGGKYKSAKILAEFVASLWPNNNSGKPYVVCTGGEPLLQLDTALIDAFHAEGFEIAVETNGTIQAPQGIDWICVSPKASAEIIQVTGSELKLVYPQEGNKPDDFEHLAFGSFYLQPLDNEQVATNIQKTIAFCQAHPKWHLSLQTHKIIGIK